MKQTRVTLERLQPDRLGEVIDALADAFHEYPVMRYILKDAGTEFDVRLGRLVAYFTESRFTRGWPVLGLHDGTRLVAAANVNPPESVPAPPELKTKFEQLRAQLGDGAIGRFNAFADACAPLEPKKPHYYLGMIGVRRDEQGKGLSRRLLDEIHRMSAEDDRSNGVVLTTETRKNLTFYEHFGYRILGQANAEELVTWTLFREDR